MFTGSIFSHWKVARWAQKLRLGNRFELKDGRITVTSPGIYYLYAQVLLFARWQCCFNWSALQINYLDESDVNGFQVRECILYSFTCVRVHFVYFMFVRVYSLHFFVYCAWCLDNFQIYVNDSPTFLCTAMTHTPTLTTKANTCYTGETLPQVSITFSSSRGCHFLGAWRSSLCEELGCE